MEASGIFADCSKGKERSAVVMREEASTVPWITRLGTGPNESGKQLRGPKQRESTRDKADDLSQNGAKFRQGERKLEFARDWRGIRLGVELEHWQKSVSWKKEGRRRECLH